MEEEQHGEQRAQYGAKLIANLASELTREFGVGYNKRSLEQYRRFYLCFKDLEIVNACVRNLTWTHFRIIMREPTPEGDGDNPTIGVLLCTDTDNTIARYSVLHDNEQLFAAKYMAYMPTEEELRREIEQQKQFFLNQHSTEL